MIEISLILFVLPGADINTVRPTDNKTPLHVAAAVSAPAEMITLLLQHGANIYDLDTEGKKAVDLAPMDSQAYGVLKHYAGKKRIKKYAEIYTRTYYRLRIKSSLTFCHSLKAGLFTHYEIFS